MNINVHVGDEMTRSACFYDWLYSAFRNEVFNQFLILGKGIPTQDEINYAVNDTIAGLKTMDAIFYFDQYVSENFEKKK